MNTTSTTTPNELRAAAERLRRNLDEEVAPYYNDTEDVIAVTGYILATVKPGDGAELARLRAENERWKVWAGVQVKLLDTVSTQIGELNKERDALSAAIAEFVDVAEDVVNCSPIEDSGRLVSERDIARLHALVLRHTTEAKG